MIEDYQERLEYLVILVQLVLKESHAYVHHLRTVCLEGQEEKEQKAQRDFVEMLVLEDLEENLAILEQQASLVKKDKRVCCSYMLNKNILGIKGASPILQTGRCHQKL